MSYPNTAWLTRLLLKLNHPLLYKVSLNSVMLTSNHLNQIHLMCWFSNELTGFSKEIWIWKHFLWSDSSNVSLFLYEFGIGLNKSVLPECCKKKLLSTWLFIYYKCSMLKTWKWLKPLKPSGIYFEIK